MASNNTDTKIISVDELITAILRALDAVGVRVVDEKLLKENLSAQVRNGPVSESVDDEEAESSDIDEVELRGVSEVSPGVEAGDTKPRDEPNPEGNPSQSSGAPRNRAQYHPRLRNFLPSDDSDILMPDHWHSRDRCDCYERYGTDDDFGGVRHIMCNRGW
ncbi:hypothetical protein BYT27DRAFT_7206171 [Phlegmacium glaucopus]|nr:hypothetical protein BYT27DRAFT_7206171 [Phlegmacium glaucopus]